MRAFYQNNAVRPFVVLASEFFLFASHIPIPGPAHWARSGAEAWGSSADRRSALAEFG